MTRGAFWLLAGANFAIALGYGVILPLLPTMLGGFPGIESRAFVAWHIGGLLGIYMLGLFVTAPLWGALSDRIGGASLFAGTSMALLLGLRAGPAMSGLVYGAMQRMGEVSEMTPTVIGLPLAVAAVFSLCVAAGFAWKRVGVRATVAVGANQATRSSRRLAPGMAGVDCRFFDPVRPPRGRADAPTFRRMPRATARASIAIRSMSSKSGAQMRSPF